MATDLSKVLCTAVWCEIITSEIAARRSQMDSVARKTIVIVSNQRHNRAILLTGCKPSNRVQIKGGYKWSLDDGSPIHQALPCCDHTIIAYQLSHRATACIASTPSSLYPLHSTSYCVLSLHDYSCYILIVFCKFSMLHQFYHDVYRCTDGQVHQLQCHICSYMWDSVIRLRFEVSSWHS